MKKNHLLFICSFLFSLSSNILSLSFVYLLTDRFSFNPGGVGAYVAAGSFSYFLGCNIYHRTQGRPWRVIPAAVSVTFVSSIFLGHVRDYRVVALCYILVQGSTGLYWPPVMAWFTQGLDESALNRDIGIFNRSWMTGNLLGPLIAGALYHWNSRINFIAVNAGFLLVLVIFLFLLRRIRKASPVEEIPPAPEDSAANGPLPAPTRPQLRPNPRREKIMDLYRYRGWIGAVSSNMFVGILINIVPLHIRDGLGYTERAAGFVLFTRCAAGLIGFTVLARFTRWHFNRRWFVLAQSGLVFCALALTLAGNRLGFYLAVVFLYGLVNSCCYNNSIFYSSATGRNPRKNLALHEIFLSIGSACGALGGGFCYQRLGFSGAFFVLSLFLGLGLAIFIVLNNRERPA
ncbi:MAG: MFS transporter [Treponema sp.]|jgi:predicted MFS family arabinose efflux permease|nr:MFS transporter [Treponema sp.]